MGCFRFGEPTWRVKQGYFHGIIGSKAVRTSGHYSDLIIKALDSAGRNLAFGPEPVQQQFLMSPQHAGDPLHRLNAAAQGAAAPDIEKSAGPTQGTITPEVLKG